MNTNGYRKDSKKDVLEYNIGENVWIDNLASVSIGATCCLSQGAMLLTGNHNYKKTTFDLLFGLIFSNAASLLSIQEESAGKSTSSCGIDLLKSGEAT